MISFLLERLKMQPPCDHEVVGLELSDNMLRRAEKSEPGSLSSVSGIPHLQASCFNVFMGHVIHVWVFCYLRQKIFSANFLKIKR